jgi:hypothetical protein
MNVTDVYCRFPSFEVALAVGSALRRAEDPTLPDDYMVEALQPDGVFGNNRYDIVQVGTIWEPTGETDEDGLPVMAEVPGFHCIGRFRGPDPVPEALAPFIVEPWNQVLG